MYQERISPREITGNFRLAEVTSVSADFFHMVFCPFFFFNLLAILEALSCNISTFQNCGTVPVVKTL